MRVTVGNGSESFILAPYQEHKAFTLCLETHRLSEQQDLCLLKGREFLWLPSGETPRPPGKLPLRLLRVRALAHGDAGSSLPGSLHTMSQAFLPNQEGPLSPRGF